MKRSLLAGMARVVTGASLVAGLLISATAQAKNKSGHHRPLPKPVQCDIPDDLYVLAGVLEDDQHISLALGIIQGKPVLHIHDKNQSRQILVSRTHQKPQHKHGHHHHKPPKGHRRHEAPQWPHHGHHKHGHHPAPACVGTQLTMNWQNKSSAPAGLKGSLALGYQNNSLTGQVIFSGKGTEVDDKSVTLQLQ